MNTSTGWVGVPGPQLSCCSRQCMFYDRPYLFWNLPEICISNVNLQLTQELCGHASVGLKNETAHKIKFKSYTGSIKVVKCKHNLWLLSYSRCLEMLEHSSKSRGLSTYMYTFVCLAVFKLGCKNLVEPFEIHIRIIVQMCQLPVISG